VISGNIITGNSVSGRYGVGGGISCFFSSAIIINNYIAENSADGENAHTGGIFCYASWGGESPTIANNIIISNSTANHGGGIACEDSSPAISNNLIAWNSADRGGGLYFYRAQSKLSNNTIYENSAVSGSGIYCGWSSITTSNSIHWHNEDANGKEIHVVGDFYTTSKLFISYSDLEGGQDAVSAWWYAEVNWGPGMIDEAPLFVSDSTGDYFLSQRAAGQPADSPCVDTGDPESTMISGATRTDLVQDGGILDMGYHHPVTDAAARLVAGPGPAVENQPLVRVFMPAQDAEYEHAFRTYGASQYGVHVSCGNVNDDAPDEILTGAGPGSIYGPHVRGFLMNGTPILGLSFLAYTTHKYGVHVALADIDKDGYDEIITGAGPGAVFGPHVRAFDFDGTASVSPIADVNLMAYQTRQWGVKVSGGDLDGDGYDEIVTGPGPGPMFGPHVRGWDVDGTTAAAMPAASFFAYPTRSWGVNVSCGELDGHGHEDIVSAPGPSGYFNSNIRGWRYDGSGVTLLPGCSFSAWPASQARFGAQVFAGTDLDEDGLDDLVIGAGPDPNVPSLIKVYRYNGMESVEWFSLTAFPSSWTHGASVAAGKY
jgi:hypothetical protein